jgi:predicted DCC family thiol-disulfide oxidoreductase YuxK
MAKIIQLKKTLIQELNSPVILYDGVCNFCNAIVNFILKHDKNKKFLFAPIQSKEARLLLRNLNEPFANLKTVYLIDDKKVYKRSVAVFKILEKLSFPFKAVALFQIFPTSLTDYVYKFIAKNRYKWFGKAEKVITPDESVKERFLAKS